MKFPYNEISAHIETIYDAADDSVTVTFDTNELHFSRESMDEFTINGKTIPEAPEVNLYFSYESACKLRDFLNFALPIDKYKLQEKAP